MSKEENKGEDICFFFLEKCTLQIRCVMCMKYPMLCGVGTTNIVNYKIQCDL